MKEKHDYEEKYDTNLRIFNKQKGTFNNIRVFE